jgi:hypothetical protein
LSSLNLELFWGIFGKFRALFQRGFVAPLSARMWSEFEIKKLDFFQRLGKKLSAVFAAVGI